MRTPDLAGPPLDHPDDVLDLIEPWLGTDRTAIVDAEGALSYRDLDELARGLAGRLLALEVAPGDPVRIHARLGRWAVVAMLGVLRSGARYVAIDAAFPRHRREAAARASGATIAVVEPGVADCGPFARSGGVTVVPAGAVDSGPAPPGGLRRGPLAYTCFTSGSTGTPQPVTISSAALAYSTAARLAYYPEPVTGFLLCSSISFDSSVAGIYWTLACGGTLVIPADRPADLAALGRFAVAYRPSHLLMVPSLYTIALSGGLAERLGSLSTVIVAGEDCPPSLVERHFRELPGARLYNEYGPTEATVWSTVHRCEPADGLADRVPIGRPIPGASLWVEPVPAGAAPGNERGRAVTAGELAIGGPGVAGGGIYRTGDLVSLREGGDLLFHGRLDHQLKIGGLRVERAEIEHALTSFPGVSAAAVGVHRADGRTTLMGFVVAGGEPDRRRLRAHLMARLPAVAVPAQVTVVAALPLLPNGKVDYSALDGARAAGLSRGPEPRA